MSGTITDPNGAVIPGVKVKAVHEPTGREYSVQTTGAGLYVFAALPTGPYVITVEQTGFKKLVRTGIEIRIASRQDLDMQLEVGDVQQQIEVKAEAPLLETTSAERGQNISPQVISSLPIYTGGLRSAEAFVAYMPGVNTVSETSINGSIGRAKEILIDGGSITIPESGGVSFYFPGFEAFGEMKLVTSTFNAEYGRLGGGMEVFNTKSGANALHGGAFLNLRRDIWNAAAWASNATPGQTPGFRPKERYNEEGIFAGGPVYIPKVYDGRNKTFFFMTYTKDVRPISFAVNAGETLPTLLMRQGNFSELKTQIYDPASTTTDANGNVIRTPFAGNIIPKNRFSSISSKILDVIPNPNNSQVISNYDFISTSEHRDYVLTLKGDHSITDSNRVSFFMTHRNYVDESNQYLPGPLSNGLISYQRPDLYRVNHDLMVSPTFLLHSTFAFTRDQNVWNNPLQNGYGSKFGFPLTGNADATPYISFATDNLQSYGMNQGKVNNGGQWNWTTHVSQQATWVRGKHEFKFGWDIRRLRTIADDWAGSNGSYGFSRFQTAQSVAAKNTTGNAFASFLLGAANSGSATATPVSGNEIRYGYHAGFFQDNWRVTPRFTFNYGIRYEVPIGWHDLNGYSNMDPTKPNPGANNLPGALVFSGYGAARTGEKRFYPTDFSNFGPRVGFAYRLADKTTIRGGFGIFYQTLGNGGCGCRTGFNGSYNQDSDGFNAAFNWDQGGVKPPAGFKPPPQLDPSYGNYSTIYRLGPNYGKAPRIYNWSLEIQQEYKQYLFEIAYVGNRGHGLNSTVYMNQLPTSYLSLGSLLSKKITDPAVVAGGYKEPYPGFAAGWGNSATLAQALRPFPQYGTVVDVNAGVGQTWYDSLQAKVERRFGGLQLMGSYVWSKSLALMTYRQIFSQGSQVQAADSYNIPDAKSYMFFDIPHFVKALVSYQLPFGRGKRFFGNAGRAMNLVVGGWALASSHQYRSGNLIQIYNTGNPNGSGVLFTPITRLNATGSPIRTGVSAGDLDPRNTNSFWFNAASKPYANAPAYTMGTASMFHSEFRNPWLRTENLSLSKDFYIWESVKLQYRADANNIFNRTAFGNVDGNISSANFGRPTGAMVGARMITMGLRLEF